MPQSVLVGSKSLTDYRHVAGRDLVDQVYEIAKPLMGLRVLNLNATGFGGGVAELLYTMVPLMRDVGLDVDWQVIQGDGGFFAATKRIHNALQGDPDGPDESAWQAWERCNALNAQALSSSWDVCIVHDPQPAALRSLAPETAGSWLWRCHIDLSTPNPAVLERLLPYLTEYHGVVFHLADYIPTRIDTPVHLIPPAIDPLAPKNAALGRRDAALALQRLGIDLQRPILCQISRFDPWKDPFGVIDAYRRVKSERRDVQLVLAGSMANDDPEGSEYFAATVAHAAGDPDIHVLSNLDGVGAIEVNALQSCSDVVIQKSTREGFGLTVSEALWKGRPVIGGAVGGIPLQIEHGRTGYLVDSVEHCAARALALLADPDLADKLGRAGKERVRTRFLTPRLMRDWLLILAELIQPAGESTAIAAA